MRNDVVTRVRRFVDLQCCFSPLSHHEQSEGPAFLFVQDPQNVDDIFDITWFWAKDPKGLEHLSHVDMLSFGLREPCLSKIYVDGENETLREPRLSPIMMKRVQFVREALGLAADLDIARFLDLPIASLEWDGTF